MTEQASLDTRLDELEERVRGLQIGLQNLVVAICTNGDIDVSKVAMSYNKLNETIRTRVSAEDGPCRAAMDHIGKVLQAAGTVIDQGREEVQSASQNVQ